MLQNAYFLANIGTDTAENEQHFAEILPTDAHRARGETGRAAVLVDPTGLGSWSRGQLAAARARTKSDRAKNSNL